MLRFSLNRGILATVMGIRNAKWAVGAGFLIHLLLGVPYAYAVLRSSFAAEFDLTDVTVAWPFSAILVAYTVGMVIGGPLHDRHGPRVLAPLGVALFGGGFALASTANSLVTLMLTYGLMCGLGNGLVYMAAVGTAVRWHPKSRGTATGLVVLGFGLSSAILAPLLTWLLEGWGWRSAMLWVGLAFVAVGVPLALTLRDPLGARSEQPTGESALKSPLFWKLWLGWFLGLGVGLAWLGQLPSVGSGVGFTTAAAALLVSAIALTNGFGRPAVGWLSDRIGRTTCLIGASLIGALGLGLVAALMQPWAVWTGAVLFGLAFAGWLVNMAPTAAERFGAASTGRVYGQLFSAYGVGAMVFPPLAGWVTESSSVQVALGASAGVLVLAAGVFGLCTERFGKA